MANFKKINSKFYFDVRENYGDEIFGDGPVFLIQPYSDPSYDQCVRHYLEDMGGKLPEKVTESMETVFVYEDAAVTVEQAIEELENLGFKREEQGFWE